MQVESIITSTTIRLKSCADRSMDASNDPVIFYKDTTHLDHAWDRCWSSLEVDDSTNWRILWVGSPKLISQLYTCFDISEYSCASNLRKHKLDVAYSRNQWKGHNSESNSSKSVCSWSELQFMEETSLAQWWHPKADDDTAGSRDYSPGIFGDLMIPWEHILGELSW